MRVVLASASPRRRELLAQAGVVFEVQTADIDETPLAEEQPAAYTSRLALEKARAVFHKLGSPANTIVIGADTTVTIDGHILAKPEDDADATRMLKMLRGRGHVVITGVALVSLEETVTHSEETTVFFSPMTEEEIAMYIATTEPMDKAGAYGIQGMAARWIPRVEGDYANVVGLPLAKTCELLKQLGGL